MVLSFSDPLREPTSRRELLPDIEEINSTLRSTGDRDAAGGDPAPDAPSALAATAVSESQINLTWADNSTCAVSCTGVGEEFIRFGVAQRIADLMEYAGFGVEEAAHTVVHEILSEGDGGVIALDAKGNAHVRGTRPPAVRRPR